MIDCVIIEDEPLARRLLEDYIQRVSDLHLIESFSDAMKGLQYLQENEISLLFLDIQMPDLNGLSLLKLLKTSLMSSSRQLSVNMHWKDMISM